MDFRSLVPFGPSSSQIARRGEDPFASFRREMDRMFDDFFSGRGLTRWPGGGDIPVDVRFDVAETDSEVKVTAELPGVDENDVEVTLADDLLTIKGEKKREQEKKAENYHMVERSYGSFARSLRLPFAVDQSKVDAQFKKGVLTITLPKPPDAQKPARKIDIKAA